MHNLTNRSVKIEVKVHILISKYIIITKYITILVNRIYINNEELCDSKLNLLTP